MVGYTLILLLSSVKGIAIELHSELQNSLDSLSFKHSLSGLQVFGLEYFLVYL